jgi:hypothetical protein
VTDRFPLFDDLVDLDLPAEERARLRAAHNLLIAAGPAPELPSSLQTAPTEPAAIVIRRLPHRRRFAAIAAAAVLVAGLLGTGYAIGHRGGAPEPVQTVAMAGAGAATASIELFSRDEAGNWPMTLEVSGLAPLPPGQTYALWLTRKGELADPCGTFTVATGTTKVPLNAPYPLKDYDGWVVVRSGTTQPFLLQTGDV